METEEAGVTDRLRTPPAERFAGPKHLFSLPAALEQLRAEDHPARDGHRQVTIFQRAPVTQVLFSFEPEGRFQEHSAPGLVTIHALEGRLVVSAEGEANELGPGSVLILDPEVPHDVRALEPSAMLLTVHLQKTG
jgi:quercetin dioxygenase-like cupin family protein